MQTKVRMRPLASSRLKAWLVSSLHVSGLWALAAAQPVLDVVGRAPEFFITHDAGPLDILVFTGLVVFAPALALVAIVGVAALVGRRTADAVTALAVGALCALFAAQVGYRLGAQTWLTSGTIAAAAAVLGAAAWVKLRTFHVALNIVGAAAVIVPLAFLLSGGIRPLMRMDTVQVAQRTASRLPPVVLVVFDELPLVTLLDERGQLDARRYPNVAALAADGVWFRGATTVSDYTRWALPAILTGRFPRALSVPTPGDYPNTLFTLLARSHRMEVLEPLTALCPAQLCGRIRDPFWVRQAGVFADVRIVASYLLLPPAARTDLPDISQGWGRFDEDKLEDFRRVWRKGEGADHPAAAVAFIDGITKEDSQPTLYFLHTLASHHPPRWLPSGQAIISYSAPPALKRGTWTNADWAVTQYQQGHLVQARLADTLVGRLRARLQDTGLYERALVVVVADHGFSFRPGGLARDFTMENAGEIMPVPFIVKLPADRRAPPPGTSDDRNIETIDILPMIADVLGIDLPWPVDGKSPWRGGPPRAEKRIAYKQASKTASFTTADVARLRDAEVQRKVAAFGTGAWPSPSPTGLAPLAGRRLDSFTLEDPPGTLRLEMSNQFALDNVDLDAPALPAQVKGRVVPRQGAALEPVYLALALNGEIVATTRTWPDTADWMALMPPDHLRKGHNDVEVFVVDPARPDRLIRTRARREIPPGENLLFSERAKAVASYDGFYHVERSGTAPYHWTDGNAAIRVPIDRAHKPTTLTVDVLSAAREGTRLRVLLDDCEVLAELLPAARWSRSVDVSRCSLPGRWTTIRFVSDTRPPRKGDTRRLGIALLNAALR